MEAVIVMGVLIIGLLLILLIGQFRRSDGSQSALLIKQDLTALNESVTQLKDGLQSQINERLDKSNAQMLNQLKESSVIIKDVTQKLTALEKTNQQVGNIAGELKVLQNVLSNPKQRGVLGEYYLSQVLENVLPPNRFQLQYDFKDGETVDAIIKLDDKILPIDSKFSLENYNRLMDAKSSAERDSLARQFKSDLKKRIDETAKYIRPMENTMDYAFMFIPSEAIYYDLLINKVGASGTSARDLLEYAFREKNVIIVSPTTFMAYLQTVLQGLRALQIEEQAKEIQLRVGELGRHLVSHEKLMQKLGKSLGTTVGHFTSAHKELKKVDKDIVKISGKDVGVEPLLLDKPYDSDD